MPPLISIRSSWFLKKNNPAMKPILHTGIILYVHDQEKSMQFYRALFRRVPDLHVSGMTEFKLSDGVTLGLMPNAGIVRLLGNAIPDPESGFGIPRCELYLEVGNVEQETAHAADAGAAIISPATLRDWGHTVAYVSDPDGHIIAFAQK